MKRVLLSIALMLGLAGCINEWVSIYSLRAVTTGGIYNVGDFETLAACLEAVDKRVQVTFTDLMTYTASSEEEHGLGLVLVCVEARISRKIIDKEEVRE